MSLSLIFLPLKMFHAFPLLDSSWPGMQPAFPSSHISWPPCGCSQWELLLGDYRVGRLEKQGYSFSLLLWVEQLLPLFDTSFLQACPPWSGVSK